MTVGRVILWGFVIAVFVIAALSPIAGAVLPDTKAKFSLQEAGNVWLGFCAYFSGVFLILCILFRGSILLSGKEKNVVVGESILIISALCALILMVYGMIHAQHTKVKEYDITIRKEADGLTDLKIVLIADLHLSVNSRLSMTQRMVRLINEQHPDVVLVAGDVFTSTYEGLKNPERYSAALREIEAPYGVYAVYGNHDVKENLFGGFPVSPVSKAFRTREMEEFFEKSGFTVLYDEIARIADGRVQIAGRIDGSKAGDGTADRAGAAELLSGIDREKPVIVLEHEPVEFRDLRENGADLILCGHTHAGQFFPGNLIVPFFNENPYGYRVVDGVDTVVTSGVGYYGPPLRIGTNSEVTVIHVHFR